MISVFILTVAQLSWVGEFIQIYLHHESSPIILSMPVYVWSCLVLNSKIAPGKQDGLYFRKTSDCDAELFPHFSTKAKSWKSHLRPKSSRQMFVTFDPTEHAACCTVGCWCWKHKYALCLLPSNSSIDAYVYENTCVFKIKKIFFLKTAT